MLAGSLLIAVVATPFAAHAAAAASHDAAVSAQREQRVATHEVKAMLLRPASRTAEAGLDSGVLTQAKWTSLTGAAHTGQVLARPGAPEGTGVVVWTDAAGNLARPPLTDSQVAGQADLAETGAIAGMVALLASETILVRHLIYRRRMARWDAEWAVTGPAWNRQRW